MTTLKARHAIAIAPITRNHRRAAVCRSKTGIPTHAYTSDRTRARVCLETVHSGHHDGKEALAGDSLKTPITTNSKVKSPIAIIAVPETAIALFLLRLSTAWPAQRCFQLRPDLARPCTILRSPAGPGGVDISSRPHVIFSCTVGASLGRSSPDRSAGLCIRQQDLGVTAFFRSMVDRSRLLP